MIWNENMENMEHYKIEWKCGRCGKIYDTNQLISLEKIKLVESDNDPTSQHGFTPVCECGYIFHIDRWRLNDQVKIKVDDKEIECIISTVFLELNNKMLNGKDEYYETAIIFPGIDEEHKDIEILERYESKEEAIGGHNRILNLIIEGKYKIEKVTFLEKEENRIIFIN